jgi:hypothetical protein
VRDHCEFFSVDGYDSIAPNVQHADFPSLRKKISAKARWILELELLAQRNGATDYRAIEIREAKREFSRLEYVRKQKTFAQLLCRQRLCL